ncbi:MAG: GAF domain-containing protein [Chloroflexi bacterium]|nr:GAF domain-containing protein [Chloroflexota bacterium]
MFAHSFCWMKRGRYLEMRSAMRTTSPYQPRPPLKVGEGVMGQVLQTGRMAYVADVREDGRYLGSDLAREEGWSRCWLCL